MMEKDVAAEKLVKLLSAILDHASPPWQPDVLPPLGHWLLFPPATRQSLLGDDGHPPHPHADLPRRMWAGSRVRFFSPIPIGSAVRRETVMLRESEKMGRSGVMRFITLQHRLHVEDQIVLEEEQDLVYRQAAFGPAGGPPQQQTRPASGAPAEPPAFTRQLRLDSTVLFRFSALTFNAHRIHYDRDYALSEEGYQGLVVQGPFLAMLLMDLYQRQNPQMRVCRFSFRALSPVFDQEQITLGLTSDSAGCDLLVLKEKGEIAMRARIDCGMSEAGTLQQYATI
jgi:3-methylfumaryl-CoA hydratase